jgi:hypothetical protein
MLRIELDSAHRNFYKWVRQLSQSLPCSSIKHNTASASGFGGFPVLCLFAVSVSQVFKSSSELSVVHYFTEKLQSIKACASQ